MPNLEVLWQFSGERVEEHP